MKRILYKLECLTDMHVGSGEANYSIIDNEVQRDTVLTDVPIIHASGVKGALRQHFEGIFGQKNEKVLKIFGGDEMYDDVQTKEKKKRTKEGEYKFFNAVCIARPLRVTHGACPYILTTGVDVLESFSKFIKGLGLSGFYDYEKLKFQKEFLSNVPGLEIEGKKTDLIETTPVHLEQLKRLIGPEFAIAESLQDYDLPTRARNKLDNGKSEHLWYEELVPHKSIFYFVIVTSDDECELIFEKTVPIQFGGNATIGNGYTTIEEVFSK